MIMVPGRGVGMLLMVLLWGCGNTEHHLAPGPVTGDATASGEGGAAGGAGGSGVSSPTTRLVPWQLEAEGTEPLVLGTYDTQEQAYCHFETDSEGELRCLPPQLPPAVLPPAYLFADPECTQPLYEIDAGVLADADAQTRFTLPLPSQGCMPERHVVATVKQLAAGTAYVSEGNGTCSETVDFSPPAKIVVDKVVDPQRYVRGTLLDGPLLNSRTRLVRVQGEDGSLVDDHLVDQHWSTPCTLTDSYCVPFHVEEHSYYFTDPLCTMPVWRVPACAPETFILGSDKIGGDAYALGEPYAGIVSNGGHGCHPGVSPVDLSLGDRYFFRGAQLPQGEAVGPVDWQPGGTGRLQRRMLGGAPKPVPVADYLAAGPRYHDATTGADCDPVWTPEGLVRCVATDVLRDPTFGAYLFVDPQCTTPAFFCYPEVCDNPPLAVVMEDDGRGGRRASKLASTLKISGSYGLITQDGACTFNAMIDALKIGDTLPWDMYPALDEKNAASH